MSTDDVTDDLFPISADDGRRLRDEGIKRAIDHAEAVNLGWANNAFVFTCEWMPHKVRFQSFELITAAASVLPKPPKDQAWGEILLRAHKAQLIEKDGFEASLNPKAHRRPCQVWRVMK